MHQLWHWDSFKVQSYNMSIMVTKFSWACTCHSLIISFVNHDLGPVKFGLHVFYARQWACLWLGSSGSPHSSKYLLIYRRTERATLLQLSESCVIDECS